MTLSGKVHLHLVGLLCLLAVNVWGQDQKLADSLRKIYLENELADTARMELLRQLSFNEVTDLRSASQYADELISLAGQAKNNKYLFHGYLQKGNKKRLLGDWKEALDAYFKSAQVAKASGIKSLEGSAYAGVGDVYALSNNYQNATAYYNKAITTLRQTADSVTLASILLNAGDALLKYKNYDSALLYFKESGIIFERENYLTGKAYTLGNVGMVYAQTGKNDLAENNFEKAISILDSLKDYSPICDYLLSLARMYLNKGEEAAALTDASRSLALAQDNNFKEQIRNATLLLSQLYEKFDDPRKSLLYYKDYIVYRDSIDNKGTIQKMADLRTNFEVSQKQQEVNLLNRQKKLQRILLIAALVVLAVIVVLVMVLLKNNRQKQKAFMLLRKERDVTVQQRDQTDKALHELKRTQAHLIQSEKMASLGQLTAGIAHEIQNPLNFVNNFSEVNAELITELQEENKKGNTGAVQSLSEEIFTNAEKISQHGKRAGAIVKGMLEHSRVGAPEKRLTNINALADEYFRLAYLGLRAKDKSFNAIMHTDFDPQVGEVNVVAQEIGRVILNLVNNAFYAVVAKSRDAPEDYIPTVSIRTKKTNDHLIISVKDNGTGISNLSKEKIFQPFFTTKGPGIGTGLGLSISYDIVKAHGGEIKLDSHEGTGTEFTVVIPLEKSDA